MRKYAVWLLLVFLITTFYSCGKNRGCSNEWALNYDPNADTECCCEYDVDQVIRNIVGPYSFRENCSTFDHSYQIRIRKRPSWTEDIIINNFNNSGESISAKFDSGKFRFNNDHKVEGCEIQVTGSINKIDGRLFFTYAAIPDSGYCDDFKGRVCEGYSDL